MRKQRVLLGALTIDNEPPIELQVELVFSEVRRKSAVLKDRLVYLLDTRFRPAMPEPRQSANFTIADVTDLFQCHRVTVLRMIRRGQLHPVGDGDEMYFDPAGGCKP